MQLLFDVNLLPLQSFLFISHLSDYFYNLCPEWESNPHALKAGDFKSPMSTNFIIRAISIPVKRQMSFLEVQAGIEPAHGGFADRSVTTSPLHHVCMLKNECTSAHFSPDLRARQFVDGCVHRDQFQNLCVEFEECEIYL